MSHPHPGSAQAGAVSVPDADTARRLALRGDLPILGLIAVAEQLTRDGQPQAAARLYRDWIAHHDSPALYVAHFNLGVLLANVNEHAGAEQSYRAALALVPDFPQAHLNLGTVLERMGRPEEALDAWRAVLARARPAAAEDQALLIHALNNLGRLLEIRRDNVAAEAMLARSLALDPKQPQAIAHWVHLRQKLCIWPAFAPFPGATHDDLLEAASALALLAESGDPAVQLAASQRYVDKKVLPLQAPLAPADGYDHPRLRIGYLSSDFCNHAVSILSAELYALHDRSKVEVYGFSWSRDDGSALRARVVGAMDHYIRIDAMSDEEAARCIRDHEIDILVDLHGLTLGTRHDILSWRPAPVQVTYLGFPGTTALPAIDYVIADEFVFPEKLKPFFTEKPLYLPDSFQINDRERAIGPRPTRASVKLPDDAFVLCCFNSTFKITPEVFDAWLQILLRAPRSVLWLIADQDAVRVNLTKAAIERGVDPARLVFAERVAPENYLARYQVADLFLDTYPFNAGTTASDALWAGLPILTCSGDTFASRMAGSLLHAVDLPELVACDLSHYIETGVALASDPALTAAMKHKLHDTRLSCTLFDSPRLVRALEEQFMKIAKRPESSEDTMKQTPINQIHNADVLHLMRPDYRRVIEVGSSSGALAHAYRGINANARYTGIEIDREYAEASKAHCTDVIHGNAEHLPPEIFQTFADGDCWVFADALEHLYDPWKLLKKIRSNAAGPVDIVACIPNAQNWSLQATLNNGNFAYQDSGLLDRTHIRWFTRTTIIQLFESAGFQITAMTARIVQPPSAEVAAAIRAMASATGGNPELAVDDSVAFQYVVKAVLKP
ncbi:O-linked N-acetylglucosamine transferase family protein [Massilia niastensis]|uniref:O-linked N-acetylglucosamine transferase family protein n=1 Tax=Massilia niastensis TaxID=544911 RepID=UPI000378B791|nr:tetratricopeptide repeat protein [Massilia niastensis]